MKNEAVPTQESGQDEKLEEALGHMMTPEEYARKRYETPYVFSLNAGGKELHYLGSGHENDPKHPEFVAIEDILNKTSPDIVFVEGIKISGEKEEFNKMVQKESREQTIREWGEPSFAVKLALEKGIDWHSPEPSDEDLYKHLLGKGFSKEEIFAWAVLRILRQYSDQKGKRGFKEYTSGYIERFKQVTDWRDFDYSYERAIKLGELILGRQINTENTPDANDLVDPIPYPNKQQTSLNKVNREASNFRDRKIVTEIAKALKTHNKIFVIYGSTHAVMQEPALRQLFVQGK